MNKILLRSISGAIYVGIIVAGLLCGPRAFGFMIALLTTLAAIEFGRLNKIPAGLLWLDTAIAIVITCGTGGVLADDFSARAVAITVIGLLCIRLVGQLYAKSAPISTLAWSMTSVLYIACPLAMMTALYFNIAGPHLLLALFVFIWLNDTGAYLVGSRIGRHRLWERISPKKSWEGFWGGLIVTVIGATVAGTCFREYFAGLSLPAMAGLGAITAVAGTYGDLIESMIKRSLGVKDSGRLIPGHGGILDRIDSLLLVVPAATVYLIILTLCSTF